MDDFAKQIAEQEWWSSFGFIILVIGLLGDIATLAVPVHRGRLEKYLTAIFTAVIIIGCAYEHVAENKIADLIALEQQAADKVIAESNNQAQQAKLQVAQIRDEVAPRELTKAEQNQIADQLRQFNERTITLQSYMGDTEGHRLLYNVARAFRLADVAIKAGYWYPDQSPEMKYLLGMELWAPPEQKDFADAIEAAFSRTSIGIRNKWFVTAKGTPVTLHIGVKPFPIEFDKPAIK
jgi:hypothetical protein